MSCLLFSKSSYGMWNNVACMCCHPASIKLRTGMYLIKASYLLTNDLVVLADCYLLGVSLLCWSGLFTQAPIMFTFYLWYD